MRQIRIEQDPVPAQDPDCALDTLYRYDTMIRHATLPVADAHFLSDVLVPVPHQLPPRRGRRARRSRHWRGLFERFLAEVPDTAKRAEVEGRLAALRQATRRESEREARAAIERDQLALNARDADLRARTAEGKSGGVFASPWFWVVVGVVVVGAGTATAVAIATHDPGVQPPVVGEGGVVVIALGSP